MLLADVPLSLKQTARTNWYADLGHVPKRGQAALDAAVDAGKRHLGYFTPPQDGKSFHIARHAGAYLIFPDVHGWIVGPSYEDGSKEFGYIYNDLAKTGQLRTARSKHFDVRGGNMRVELKNMSWIQVITAKDQENLRREQLDFVIYAEATKLPSNLHDSHVYSRVEKRRGLVFYPTTHKGYGWVYEDVRGRSLPVKEGTWTWSPWVDGRREKIGGEPNPRYDEEYWSCQVSYVPEFGDIFHDGEYTDAQIAKARARLPMPMFAEQFGGEAASYAGLIYAFDPRIHECEPFEIPRSWRTVVGWDHGAGGGSDPTAIEVASIRPDGHWFWWGEVYDEQQRSVKERGGLLKILLDGRRLACPIMRGRDAKQVGWELMEMGLPSTYPDAASVDARIIKTTAEMREGKWSILRGRCPHLRKQIGTWEWDEKNNGKPREGQEDHALEAAGYAVLAPIGPEAEPLRADLDALPGESKAVAEFWQPMRESLRKQEEARRMSTLDRILDEQLFEEDPLLAPVQFIA